MFQLIRDNKALADVFLARQEYLAKTDKYGRFLYRFAANKEALQPIVSNYLIDKRLLIPTWPGNYKFAVCLTHDVERLYPGWRGTLSGVARSISRLTPHETVSRLLAQMKRDISLTPCRTFRRIVAIEGAYGAKSSFYFKATPTSTPMDEFYDLLELRDDFAHIMDMGCEVGLHAGYYSYDSLEALKEEKERLEKAVGSKITGVRMHYLRFTVPDTWRLLANAGFEYDTTFGYNDMPGFRNGVVHPFRPYDLELDREIGILEIPLIIMDAALLNLGLSRAWEILKTLINMTERNAGVLTILWHSDRFDPIRYPKWIDAYEKILSILESKKAWMTTGDEIRRYWLSNGCFEPS